MSDFNINSSNAFPRRRFIGGLAAAGSAFTLPASLLGQEASQAAQPAAPLKGHFHPKGKAPSQFTIDILKEAGTTLPFDDTRDFDEQKRGLIAPMKEMKIMADAGHVAWDMERFQFVHKQEEFDSIHPSLLIDLDSGNGGELVDQFQTAAVDAGDSEDDFVSGCLGGAQGFAGHEGKGGSCGKGGADEVAAGNFGIHGSVISEDSLNRRWRRELGPQCWDFRPRCSNEGRLLFSQL